MALARVHLQQMIQDSQDFGSDDEHMVSRIFFSMELDGAVHSNLYVNVKQTVGSSFETAPLEISKPVGYDGPWNHEAFSAAAEKYYRSLVGSAASGIRIVGANNLRMRNNTFVKHEVVEFQVKAVSGPW